MANVGKRIVLAAEYNSSAAVALSVHSFPGGLDAIGFWGDFPIGAAVHAQELDAGIVCKELLKCQFRMRKEISRQLSKRIRCFVLQYHPPLNSWSRKSFGG
jgi:hypothetical protein